MAALPNLKRAIGNKIATTLSAGVNNSALTMTVADATGMSTSGGYIIIDEADASKREIVYVESITGNTLTISTGGRGLAGTSAAAHDTGATVTDVIVDENVNQTIDQFKVGHTDTGAHVLPNNTALSIKESGGTVRDVVKVTSGNVLEIGTNNVLDHTVINAGSNKLVKIKVLRQDITTNTYTSNNVILTGWGFVQGNGTAYNGITVNFGISFSNNPILLVSTGGQKLSSNPTSITDVNNLSIVYRFFWQNISTNNFTTYVTKVSYDGNSPGVLDSSERYLFSWIAIAAFN